MTGNLRKRMLEEEHQRELARMMRAESKPEPEKTRDCVSLSFTETVTEGDRTITRSASMSVPDTAETTVDSVLRTLRVCVQSDAR